MADKDELDIKKYPRELQLFIKKEIEIVKKLVNKNDKVLDAGCGNGRAIIEIAPLVSEYVGVDIDEGYLSNAKVIANKFDNSRVIRADIENLSNTFEENEFDKTFCLFNTVSCLKNMKKALKEIFYVTKGKVYFSVCAKGTKEIRQRYYDSINVKVRFDENETTHSIAWGQVKAFNEKELITICEDVGFKVDKIELIEGCSYGVILSKI